MDKNPTAMTREELLEEVARLRKKVDRLERPGPPPDRPLSEPEQLLGLLEYLPDIVLITRLEDGTIFEVNQSFLKAMGYDREDVLGRSAAQLNNWVFAEDRDRFVREILDKGRCLNLETSFRAKDGTIIPALISGRRIRFRDQDCIISFSRDITLTKAAEIELQTAADIFRSIPSGLFIYRFEEPDRLILIDANPESERLTGIRLADWRGREYNEIWPEARAQGLTDSYLEVIRTGRIFTTESLEYNDRKLTGVFRIRAFRAPDAKLCVAFEDVTGRHQAEEALRRSRELLQNYIDNIPGRAFLKDGRGRYVMVNNQWLNDRGFRSAEEVARLTDQEIFDPETAEQYVANDSYVRSLGRAIMKEERLILEGEERTYLVAKFPIRNAPDQPAFIGGVAVDISERKKAERALRESQARYRTMAEVSLDGIYHHDGRKITFVNARTCEILGYTRDEMIGLDHLRVFHPEWRARAEARSEDRLAGKEAPSRYECVAQKKDGTRFDAQISAKMVTLDGKKGIMVWLRDISEQRRVEAEKAAVEAQLRQAQKMEAVGTLAGGIAHDFNNILQVVSGYVQLLALDRGQSPGETIPKIQSVLERAAELVRRLLTFSRKVEPELRPLDLNQRILEGVRLLERTLPKMIRIEMNLDPRLGLIRGDPNQLDQIVLNLGSNAGDAMPQGGRLTITTATAELEGEQSGLLAEVPPGRYVRVTFADTGVGVEARDLDQIFDPFFTTKEIDKGTGLGLSIVYGIVKSHQAHITCRSGPEEGTAFDLYFPCLAERVRPRGAEEPVRARVRGGPETILLVDDESGILEVGREMIAQYGYRVRVAASGEEAVEIFTARGSEIDLVILDLGMPGMGGQEAFRRIKAENPQVKVVIASGYGPEGQVAEWTRSGSVRFVAKPYDFGRLLGVVREALDDPKTD